MFEAVALETETRWSPELEIAATHAEISHALLRAFLGVHRARGTRLPEPLSIPRPGTVKPELPRLSLIDFALTFGRAS